MTAAVLLLGAGSMGGAMLRGWLTSGAIDPARSAVIDPKPDPALAEQFHAAGGALNPVEAHSYDAVVIAVKPQILADAVARIPVANVDAALMLSVAAGKSVASIRSAVGSKGDIARAMPNLPAAVGAGASGLYAPEGVSQAHRALAERLVAAVGAVAWVGSEEELDAVTAMSGSGPAYVFHLVEALAQAGVAAGLPQETAATLARATITGAGALLDADARTPAELRRAVTSPGGTTEAALKVLQGEDGLAPLLQRAVAAAKARARQLTD